MNVLVDTGAPYALLDGDDAGHEFVRPAWDKGIDAGEGFLTTDYVVLRTTALTQRCLGVAAVRTFVGEVLQMVDIHCVTDADHELGLQSLLTAGRRRLSLVDCVSLAVMRRREIG